MVYVKEKISQLDLKRINLELTVDLPIHQIFLMVEKKNTILYYVLYSFRFVIMENISTFHLALVLAFINRCKQIRKQKAKKNRFKKRVWYYFFSIQNEITIDETICHYTFFFTKKKEFGTLNNFSLHIRILCLLPFHYYILYTYYSSNSLLRRSTYCVF